MTYQNACKRKSGKSKAEEVCPIEKLTFIHLQFQQFSQMFSKSFTTSLNKSGPITPARRQVISLLKLGATIPVMSPAPSFATLIIVGGRSSHKRLFDPPSPCVASRPLCAVLKNTRQNSAGLPWKHHVRRPGIPFTPRSQHLSCFYPPLLADMSWICHLSGGARCQRPFRGRNNFPRWI